MVRPSRSSRTRDSSSQLLPHSSRDRTVSRRSEPAHTTLIGEQPNPWDLLQPQDVMSRHEVPNTAVDMSSWAYQPVIPGVPYPLSDGPSTQNHRITMTVFRLCSTCQSHGQATYHCTLRTISDRSELTFARLRYYLGGDRPSRLPLQCLDMDNGNQLDAKKKKRYFTGDSTITDMFQCLPPIPNMFFLTPM